MRRIIVLKYIILAVLLAVTSITDMRDFRIRNVYTLPAIALGVLLAGPGWKAALVDAGAGFLLFLPVALIGLAGMGDAKLCAAAAALMGFQQAGLAAWLGTVYGALWVAWRETRQGGVGEWVNRQWYAMVQVMAGRVPEGEKYPFAPFFAAGVVTALLWGWLS
ncbi:Prepilin type IV endopeptidase, peptidase domain [Moorella glycerini]|uniref:Type 4 prepilin-like proteins leader peptide-processing enzyme n=1 Tax=Neomoorella stamsii TaxID=1266720 RepID=A0A9X7J5X0_9FIRM|nr:MULTISPECIES: A24 family peptidase [Moorella]PRR76276.1 Type 4 prepilin-like proteins leader peptide-processing enzyme [Moorella stamsii]CEP67156.1 Prepilin type IV endopeptidase, peptidase domain [Moorella glycerini]